MSALAIRAHAKINLYLEVGEKLSSGYHQLTSVFQSISLADDLEFWPAEGLAFSCDDPHLSSEENLVFVAARRLRNKLDVNQGVELRLTKRTPVAAGLGGGSADAAATLIGLNEFWNLSLPHGELVENASAIGADVPFCLDGGTALVTGFGDKVRSLLGIDIGPFLVVKPTRGLSAAEVYSAFDSMGATRREVNSQDMLAAIDKGDRAEIIGCIHNDLETAAVSLMPEITEIKSRATEAGALRSFVSGSGSSVVVIPSDPSCLARIEEALVGHASVFPAKTTALGTEIVSREARVDEDLGRAVS